jgi:hypothetical protein
MRAKKNGEAPPSPTNGTEVTAFSAAGSGSSNAPGAPSTLFGALAAMKGDAAPEASSSGGSKLGGKFNLKAAVQQQVVVNRIEKEARLKAMAMKLGYGTILASEKHREKHSLVSIAAPMPVKQDDPRALTDMQAVQIFFNCLIMELFATAMWGRTDTTTSCDCGDGGDVDAFEAHPEEAEAACPMGEGSEKLLTLIITGLNAAAIVLVTVLVCRIVFRLGNSPSDKSWLYWLRFAFAWFVNLFIYCAGCATLAAYGCEFGPDETRELLIGWLTGLGISWALMEPGFILMTILLPCICNNKATNAINDRLNDIGCDLSLILG